MQLETNTDNPYRIVIKELIERHKRCTDIPKLCLPDSNDFKTFAKDIFSDHIREKFNIIDNIRIDKKHKKGNTELKISHQHQHIAMIYIRTVLTLTQRNHLKRLRKELLTRHDNGKNYIIIGYVKSIPQIIKKNSKVKVLPILYLSIVLR